MKQETLEEARSQCYIDYLEFNGKAEMYSFAVGFNEGAKWQMERSYSEEDMKEAFNNGAFKWRMHSGGKCFEEWFEQFKKK